ncbi:MauE/DoxX family redox-associated membrane protein [Nocardia terpenica]|uniref:MauE/DoxX family redox-associated membrane protein n=1 Tax=Nocardia terpenica TaxID=455432 RepID=UPI0012E78F70|nr:MauE/DoxX family redox-associated membrane protein [Nocardia terpenica]NQE91538.1 redoxin domain-containing protein [Nocardia terpenica]
MSVILLIIRILLVVILIWSGLAKLADRMRSRRAMLDFGVPAPLARPFALLLPVLELVTAGLLIPAASAWFGALAAVALLLAFTTAVGYHVARGHTPSCHCFGHASTEPIGPTTIVRNLLLTGMAATIVLVGQHDAGGDLTGWLASETAVDIVQLGLTAVAVALLAFGCRLLMQLRDTLKPATESPRMAPAFALPDLTGATVTLDDLLARGQPVLLIFSDPACGSCAALEPDITRWRREYLDRLTITVISSGAPEADGQPVLVQREHEVSDAFGVHGTPCAVVVRPDLTMSAPVCGGEEIAKLAADSAIPLSPTPIVPVGETAPDFTLPDLSGRPTSLAEFRGRATLLLFWDPGCGFCADMLPALRERDAALDEPTLLVISTGDDTENRAMGLRAPILLDDTNTVGTGFGISGTPMAILVDSSGKIASEVAAGAAAVLELAGYARGSAEVTPSAH